MAGKIGDVISDASVWKFVQLGILPRDLDYAGHHGSRGSTHS